MEPAIVDPGCADDDARAFACRGRQALRRGPAGILQRRLQHQILGRIAAEEKLGQHQEIGAERGSVGMSGERQIEVAGDIAHDRIELADGDRKLVRSTVTHGRHVAFAGQSGNRETAAPPLPAGRGTLR